MPMALPLIAAAGSVAAGISAGGLIGGLMIAGGAMTGIGALTGSKKLMQFGGILSLAGGIGGLATGAWSAAADGVAQQASQESFRALEYGAQAGAGMEGAVGGMGAAGGNAASFGADFGALNGAGGGLESLPAGGAGAPSITAPAITAPAGAAQQGITNAVNNLPNVVNGHGTTGGGMLGGLGEKLSNAADWAQKGNNPRLVQAGAGLLSAGLGAYGQQEAIKTQIQLQEEADARRRQRLNDSVRGVTVPVYQPRGG